MSQSQPAVGIDLGTTYSVVAFLDSYGRPETVRSAEGDLTVPSVVFFDRTKAIVGKEAVLAAEHEPQRIARFAKRDMGEDYCQKRIRGEQFPPEVVQAIILKKLKADGERQLGEFTQAVITVPAYFNEPRRKATQDAAKLAGVDLLDIINEPTAAAIMYGVQQGFLNDKGESQRKELVLVYDLGGGTFDATLMEIDGRNYQCVGTLGEVQLGGLDWDRRIVDHLADGFQAQHNIDPREDDCMYEVLLHQAVEAKHALSSRPEAIVNLNLDGRRSRVSLTRETFESLTKDLLDRTLDSVKRLLEMTKHEFKQLTQLVLVGGSTRMPMVQDRLAAESGLSVDRSLSPDEAVAHGAALYAGLLLGTDESEHRKISVENVNSHDLGLITVDTITGVKRRQVIIPRNTALPCSRTEKSQTAKFDQRSVKVDVVEGGDENGEGATHIGKCVVRNLPPEMPQGTPVEVIFKYERNGRLLIRAWIPTINRDATLEINRSAGLSEDQLEYWQGRITEGMTDESVPASPIFQTTAADRIKIVEAVTGQPDSPTHQELSTAPGSSAEQAQPPVSKQLGTPQPAGAPKQLTPIAQDKQQPTVAPQQLVQSQPKQLGQPKKLGQPKQLGQPAAPPKQLGSPAPVKQLGAPTPSSPAASPPQSPSSDVASGPEKVANKKKGDWKSRAKRVSAGDD